MGDLNSIIVEGVLLADSLFRVTPKGTRICTFELVNKQHVRDDGGEQEEIACFNVESHDRVAEICGERGKKGCWVRVVGRLKQLRWIGVDQREKEKTLVAAEYVEFRPEPGISTRDKKRGKNKGEK